MTLRKLSGAKKPKSQRAHRLTVPQSLSASFAGRISFVRHKSESKSNESETLNAKKCRNNPGGQSRVGDHSNGSQQNQEWLSKQ